VTILRPILSLALSIDKRIEIMELLTCDSARRLTELPGSSERIKLARQKPPGHTNRKISG
jgi:hypothetical protein